MTSTSWSQLPSNGCETQKYQQNPGDGASDPVFFGGQFGSAVDAMGARLVAGARTHDGPTGFRDVGNVVTYLHTGGLNFAFEQRINAPTGPGFQLQFRHFGSDVELSDPWLLISEPLTTSGGEPLVHVYKFMGSVWTLVQTLNVRTDPVIPFEQGTTGSLAGTVHTLSLTPNVIVIGGPSQGGGAGAAWVYTLDTMTDTWVYSQFLNDLTPAGSELYGLATAAVDDVIAVGSGFSNVEIWRRIGTNPYTRETVFTASDIGVGDSLFGSALAITPLGYLAVGAKDFDAPTANSGAVYIFEDQGGGVWLETATRLVSSDVIIRDQFGASVDIQGTTLVVGAPQVGHTLQPAGTGKSYIYRRDPNTGVWEGEIKIQPQGLQTGTTQCAGCANVKGSQFGTSVALGGKWFVTGANADDGNLENEGGIYVLRHPKCKVETQ